MKLDLCSWVSANWKFMFKCNETLLAAYFGPTKSKCLLESCLHAICPLTCPAWYIQLWELLLLLLLYIFYVTLIVHSYCNKAALQCVKLECVVLCRSEQCFIWLFVLQELKKTFEKAVMLFFFYWCVSEWHCKNPVNVLVIIGPKVSKLLFIPILPLIFDSVLLNLLRNLLWDLKTSSNWM